MSDSESDSSDLCIYTNFIRSFQNFSFEETQRKKTNSFSDEQNTTLFDKSDFAMLTKLSSGELQQKPKKKSGNVVDMLMNRQQGQFSGNTKRNIYNRYVPNTFDILKKYYCEIFCSKFSKDGQYFITGDLGDYLTSGKIRFHNSGDGSYKIEKTIVDNQRDFFLDFDISSNNEHLVYSLSSKSVFLYKLANGNEEQIPLVIDDKIEDMHSLSFSADARELLYGIGHKEVWIYDVESQRTTLKFSAPRFGVSKVVFADDASSILYTAGYDTIVRLWDRRILSESCPTPVGYLVGHDKSIIYMDPRGDGRHLITNSEDETIKLWDVRMLASAEIAQKWIRYCDYGVLNTEGDTSIMTYKGHMVDSTRITCKFSPVETTGQRYIYTGCASGKIFVYDALTGKPEEHPIPHNSYIYNVSWHPTRNEILSTGMTGLVGISRYKDPNTEMIIHKEIEIDSDSEDQRNEDEILW